MHLILGFGVTGASFLRYLNKKNIPTLIMDSRESPPGLSEFKSLKKENLFFGEYNDDILDRIDTVLLSPGIDYENKFLSKARSLNKEILTDIEVFLNESQSTKIIVTGTNGKTTAVSMIQHVLKGLFNEEKIVSCGNIGTPVLDTLNDKNDISIIETSSFHLEHIQTKNLKCEIAVLLNIEQDHLDRHKSFFEYRTIKEKVFSNCLIGIADKRVLSPNISSKKNILTNFDKEFSVFSDHYAEEVSKRINKLHYPTKANISYVLAIVSALLLIRKEKKLENSLSLRSLSKDKYIKDLWLKSLDILASFKGLEHRFEVLGTSKEGINYINDSKSTNIHSCLKAVSECEAIFGKNKTILICGGDSKNQDFSKISREEVASIKKVLIYGKDKRKIIKNLISKADCSLVSNLEEAIKETNSISVSGDVVLLSPSCSSTDMFLDYKERGDRFRKLTGFNKK